MPSCTLCGTYIKKDTTYCKHCQKYLKSGNAIYRPDSTKGEQLILGNGRRVCKICGKSYNNLSSHINNTHKMLIKEYKEMFNIPEETKLSKPTKTRSHNLTEEQRESLRKSMENARQKRKEHREDLKRRGIKRIEKHKITEEDRQRRRDAMILINLKKKLDKSVD